MKMAYFSPPARSTVSNEISSWFIPTELCVAESRKNSFSPSSVLIVEGSDLIVPSLRYEKKILLELVTIKVRRWLVMEVSFNIS